MTDPLPSSSQTYRAVAVTAPGVFELVERPVIEPGPGQVRLRVEACGVCHSDGATVNGRFPGLTFPRVPGHEVVGRIEAIGEGVVGWRLGQRVGVGFLGGEDGACPSCRRGDFAYCNAPVVTGVTTDGGYAEMMIAEARGLAAIPDELSSVEAAPLLCAGLTTFNALRDSAARAGDLVAIQGVGGLGHLGIQFARRMGFRTVALGRGEDKRALALELGAHHYIDTQAEEAAATLQAMGGAKVILATAPTGKGISELVPGLGAHGQVMVVAVPSDPLSTPANALVFSGRAVTGRLTGKAIDAEDTLAFSVLSDVRPMVETMPLEAAPQAYARMMDNKARFRIVLVMDGATAASAGAEGV